MPEGVAVNGEAGPADPADDLFYRTKVQAGTEHAEHVPREYVVVVLKHTQNGMASTPAMKSPARMTGRADGFLLGR